MMVVGLRWSLWGFEASIYNITQTAIPKIHPSPHEVYQHKGAPICPSTASQGAKTLCICDMVRGCSLWGVGASAMTLQHHSDSAIAHIFHKFTPHLQRYQHRGAPTICMPQFSKNPQDLKVLKHFVYIQYGCGMQSMGVFSLNHT